MKLSAKEISLVGLFTALTAVGAMITIPIGQVPITVQSLFVVLSGLILGPKLGPLSQLVYVILGLIGLPIFAGFQGGLHIAAGPTFGFLIGFIVASYIIGKITYNKGFSRKKVWLGSILGSLVIYVFGLPYMYYSLNHIMGVPMGISDVVKSGCLIFLPGDSLKMILAGLLAIKIVPILESQNLICLDSHGKTI